jgi:hypothetical protein
LRTTLGRGWAVILDVRGVDRLPHPVRRTWHQVGVNPQGESRIAVPEVLRQRPDVHTVE